MEAIAYNLQYAKRNLQQDLEYTDSGPANTVSGGYRSADASQRVVDVVPGTDNPLRHLKHRGIYCEECPSHAKAKANRYCVECDELYCGRCFQLCHYVPPENQHSAMDFPFDATLTGNARAQEGRGRDRFRGLRTGHNASKLDVRLGLEAEDMGSSTLTLKAARSVVQLHEQHDKEAALGRSKSSKFNLPLHYAGAPPPPPKPTTIVAEDHLEEKVNNQLPKRPPSVLQSPIDKLAQRSFGAPPPNAINLRMKGIHRSPVLRSGIASPPRHSAITVFSPSAGHAKTRFSSRASDAAGGLELPDRFAMTTPLGAALRGAPRRSDPLPRGKAQLQQEAAAEMSKGKDALIEKEKEGEEEVASKGGSTASPSQGADQHGSLMSSEAPSFDADLGAIEEGSDHYIDTARSSTSTATGTTVEKPLRYTYMGDRPTRRKAGPLPLERPGPTTHELTHIDVPMGGRLQPPLQPHEDVVRYEYINGFYVPHGQAAPGLSTDPHQPYYPNDAGQPQPPNATIPRDIIHGPHAVLTSTYARPRPRTGGLEDTLDSTVRSVIDEKHSSKPADLRRLRSPTRGTRLGSPASPSSPSREYRSWRLTDEELRRFVAGRYFGGHSLDVTRDYSTHSHPKFKVSQRVRYRSAEVGGDTKDLVVGHILSTLDPAAEARQKEEAEAKAKAEEGEDIEAGLTSLQRRQRKRKKHVENMVPEHKRLTSVQSHARAGVHNVRYYRVKWERVVYVPGQGNHTEIHIELVPEDVLEAVDDHERRVMARSIRYMLMAHLSKAFSRWVSFTEAEAEMATYQAAARCIQRAYRIYLVWLDAMAVREELEAQRQWREEKERRRLAALAREKQIEEENRKYRHLGYSMDGVRYYRTYADMMKAANEREKKARALLQALSPVLVNLQREVVEHWHEVTRHVRPFETLKANHLQNYADNEAEAELIREELTKDTQYMQDVREDRELQDSIALSNVQSETHEVPGSEEDSDDEAEAGEGGEAAVEGSQQAGDKSGLNRMAESEQMVPVDITPGTTPRGIPEEESGTVNDNANQVAKQEEKEGEAEEERPLSRARRIKPDQWETWSDDEPDDEEPGDPRIKVVGRKQRRIRAEARTVLPAVALAALDAGNVVDRRLQSLQTTQENAAEGALPDGSGFYMPSADLPVLVDEGKKTVTFGQVTKRSPPVTPGQSIESSTAAQGSGVGVSTVMEEEEGEEKEGFVEYESSLASTAAPSDVWSIPASASPTSQRLLPGWREVKDVGVRNEDSVRRELNDLSSLTVGSEDGVVPTALPVHGTPVVFGNMYSEDSSTWSAERSATFGSTAEPPKDDATLRAEAAAAERKAKRQEPDPWHPAIGAKLPDLPQIGVTQLADTSVRVDHSNKFASFRAYCRGSWDASNWLIKDVLQIGPYPQGQAVYDDPAITQKSSAIAKLLLDGVCTYVNLMSEEETASLITNYQEELMMKAREIRTIYVRREKAKKTAYLAKKSVFEKSENYAPERRKAFEKQYVEAKKEYDSAKRVTDSFPAKLHHIMYPLPADGSGDDRTVLALVRHLEARIRAGEKVYVFSKLGRGRAAVVGGAILGRLYGLSGEDTLRFVQAAAGVRLRYITEPQRARPMLPDPSAKGRGNKAKKTAIGDEIFAQAIAEAQAADAGMNASKEQEAAEKVARREKRTGPVKYQARRFDLQKYIQEGKGKYVGSGSGKSTIGSASAGSSDSKAAANTDTDKEEGDKPQTPSATRKLDSSENGSGGSAGFAASEKPPKPKPITGVAAPPPVDTSGFGFHIPQRKRVYRPAVHPPIKSTPMPSPTEWMPCPVLAVSKQQVRRLVTSIDPAHTKVVNAAAGGGTYWEIPKPRGQGVPPISPITLGVTLRPDNP